MWVFMNDAFLSIVDKSNKPNCLLVRARDAEHITNVFPEAEVRSDGGTDYQYRADIPREQVAQAVSDRIRDINYDNFKSSIRDHRLHDACMRVWQAIVGVYGMAGRWLR